MKIYVPVDNISDYACYYILDKDTIRAYRTIPSYNSTINYTDFFVNSHYINKEGQQTFQQFSTIPSCVSSDNVSNNVFYRADITDILLCTIIILIICFWLPYKIISRLFGRWLKI